MTTVKDAKQLIDDLRLCLKGLDILDIDTVVNFDVYNNSQMSTDDKTIIESLVDRIDISVKSLKHTVYQFNSYS